MQPFEIIDTKSPTSMREFQVITVKSVWVNLYGKVWRFFYRAYANVRRLGLKADRKVRKWLQRNK